MTFDTDGGVAVFWEVVIDILDDLAVRRLDEAEGVDLGVRAEAADQTDVRAFRRLDRADAAVVRVVHVADVEARALAAQTAWAEGRERALVRQLGQRVGLIHELRELAGAEELADRGHDRADVDKRER